MEDDFKPNKGALYADLRYPIFSNDHTWAVYRRATCTCRLRGRSIKSLRKEFPSLYHITRQEFETRLLPWLFSGCQKKGHTATHAGEHLRSMIKIRRFG